MEDIEKMERNIEEKTSQGNLKITIGCLSLITVFLSPYLNITQISFNMNLFESAAYSFILLSFWLIACLFLRKKQTIKETVKPSTEETYTHSTNNPSPTV